MSTATRALILTWVVIGFLIIGVVGFYLGRITAPKTQPSFPGGMIQQRQMGLPGQGQQQIIPTGQFQELKGGQQQFGPQKPTGGQQMPGGGGGGFQQPPQQR